MDRRNASKLILAGTLSAPALVRPSAAFAEIEAHENDRTASAYLGIFYLTLAAAVLGSRRASPVALVFLVSGVGMLGYNLRRQVQFRDRSRADVSGLPGIGRLFHEPFEKKLARSNFLGDFHLIRNLLILNPLAKLVKRPEKTIFANQDREITIDFRPGKVNLKGGLENYQFTAENTVGHGYFDPKTRELLGFVPPVSGMTATGG